MTPKFDPDIHHRRSIRLKGFDYTAPGAYFVTLVAYQHQCLFGEVQDGRMWLNIYGEVVTHIWNSLPQYFHNIRLGESVVMPNHLHGIVYILDDGRGEASATETKLTPAEDLADASPQHSTATITKPTPAEDLAAASPLQRPTGTVPGSLGAIIQNFKSISTRKINKMRLSSGHPVWQRNYYEHIIRSAEELQRIAAYIQANPAKWETDSENLSPGVK